MTERGYRRIRTIPRTFFFSLLCISLLTTSLVGYLWISQEYRSHQEELRELSLRQISHRKSQLKEDVEDAVSYVEYMSSQLNDRTSRLLRERVELAHNLASGLYELNREKMNAEDLQVLILESLKEVRFNDGPDSVSVMTVEGDVHLLNLAPEYMGQNLFRAPEPIAEGMREAAELVHTQGEGFVSYQWIRPGQEGEFERRAYVKKFEPYGWIVAAGVYVDDIQKQVQKEVLNRLAELNLQNNEYLFAGTWEGVSLLGPRAGVNMLEVEDPNGVQIVRDLIKKAKSGGGFVEYVMPPFEGQKPLPKISYSKGITQWRWYIGAGSYVNDIEEGLEMVKGQMVTAMHWSVAQILLFISILLLLSVFMSSWMSNRLNASFGAFVEFFRKSASEKVEMERQGLHFAEFRALAESANKMIRERSKIEESLKEREETLQSILTASPIGICLVKDGFIEWTNDALLHLLGHAEEGLIGRPVEDICCEREDCRQFSQDLKRHIGEKAEHAMETRLATKDKNCLEVLLNSAQLDPNDISKGVIITVLDISERKKAIATRNSLFNLSMDMQCIARLDGHFLTVNPAFTRILGWPEETLLEKKWLDFVHPEDIEATIQAGQDLLDGKPVSEFLNRYKCKDGSYRWLSWNSIPVPGEDIAYAVARDVTESKQAEEDRVNLEQQLRHSQKLEAVGQLAGGVAHDFNNLLQAILGYSSLILQRITQEDPIYPELIQVKRAADKAAVLTARLLAFSRQQVLEPVNVDMNQIVLSVTSMIQRVIGEHISLRFNPSGESVPVLADSGQIEQVLLNLCVNARDAMQSGGQILIETQRVHLDNDSSKKLALEQPGEYVELDVTDTGCGMAPATAEKAFDPFFTTKAVGKGTGLGLATVYGIIRQHKGAVVLESEEGSGTIVRIFLPLSEGKPDLEETDVKTSVPGGDETILIAEDDAQVRGWLEKVLSGSGYTVLSTQDGVEALQVFEKSMDEIDLIILDAVMPNLGGEAVFKEVRVKSPEMPVLFATGYSPESLKESEDSLESVQVIKKPFSLVDLLTIVRNTLDKDKLS